MHAFLLMFDKRFMQFDENLNNFNIIDRLAAYVTSKVIKKLEARKLLNGNNYVFLNLITMNNFRF